MLSASEHQYACGENGFSRALPLREKFVSLAGGLVSCPFSFSRSQTSLAALKLLCATPFLCAGRHDGV